MTPNKRSARRHGGARRTLCAVALLFCLAGAAFLGKLAADEWLERRAGDDFYAGLAARAPAVRQDARTAAAATRVPDVNSASSANAAEAMSGAGANSAAADSASSANAAEAMPGAGANTAAAGSASSANAAEALPGAGASSAAADVGAPQSEIDFGALRQTCPDAVGWLRIAGTVVDYPIVQGEDNDFYLTHLADGTPNSSGSIMLDRANAGDFSDTVSILHGHHMRSGSMFGDLDAYEDEAFYRAHPTIRLCTPAGDCDVAVFAAYTVDGYAFGYPTSFADEASFDAFVRRAVSATGYETGVEVAWGDRILLLSTCAYAYDGARFVVLGKIAPSDS